MLKLGSFFIPANKSKHKANKQKIQTLRYREQIGGARGGGNGGNEQRRDKRYKLLVIN